MMKNGVYFIVIGFLVVELFKILISTSHENINFGKEFQSLGTDTPKVLPLSLRLANEARRSQEV